MTNSRLVNFSLSQLADAEINTVNALFEVLNVSKVLYTWIIFVEMK